MRKSTVKIVKRGGVLWIACLAVVSLCLGCSEENAPQIEVSKQTVQVRCESSSTSVVVTTNSAWEAVVEYDGATNPSGVAAWCHLSKSSGKGSTTINVVVDDWYAVSTHRNATIRLKTKGENTAFAAILVTQYSENDWNPEL